MVMPSGLRSSEPVPLSMRQRQRAEQRGERRHHDGPEAQQRRLDDGIARRQAARALGLEREVDHHDGVLLDDAHQQDDADQRHERQIEPGEHQRQHRADAGRRQRGQDRERVDEALVEHAEHDVDGDDGGEDQPRLAARASCENSPASPKKLPVTDDGMPILLRAALRCGNGVAQRRAGREIEADRHGRELVLVADGERRRRVASICGDRAVSGTCAPFVEGT